MSEKYVVRLKNAAIYHADNPFGSTSAEKLMRRGEMVLSDVNLCVAPGEFVYLIGRVGSGKSTLFKLLTGLEGEYEGCISVNGTDIRQLWPALYDRIGVVLQDAFLFDDTLLQNITLYRPELRERVEPVLHSLGMDAFLASHDLEQTFQNTKGNLSGGERQLMLLGRALIQNAHTLIMDEPTVAVDPQSRNKILEGIQTLNRQGSTIIYTSHYMEEVEQICTRIAIMDHGRVIAQGTKEELKQMIKTGETITVEAIALEEKNLQDIRTLDHVFDVQYEKQVLIVRCTDAKHNLIRLLNYLQSQDISFGRVFSELPTLNDVFLEITGKQLRD